MVILAWSTAQLAGLFGRVALGGAASGAIIWACLQRQQKLAARGHTAPLDLDAARLRRERERFRWSTAGLQLVGAVGGWANGNGDAAGWLLIALAWFGAAFVIHRFAKVLGVESPAMAVLAGLAFPIGAIGWLFYRAYTFDQAVKSYDQVRAASATGVCVSFSRVAPGQPPHELLRLTAKRGLPPLAEGDASWVNLRYRPHSARLGRTVGFNEDPEEWLRSLAESYEGTGLKAIILRGGYRQPAPAAAPPRPAPAAHPEQERLRLALGIVLSLAILAGLYLAALARAHSAPVPAARHPVTLPQ